MRAAYGPESGRQHPRDKLHALEDVILAEARTEISYADNKASTLLAALGIGFGAFLGGLFVSDWRPTDLESWGEASWCVASALSVAAVGLAAGKDEALGARCFATPRLRWRGSLTRIGGHHPTVWGGPSQQRFDVAEPRVLKGDVRRRELDVPPDYGQGGAPEQALQGEHAVAGA